MFDESAFNADLAQVGYRRLKRYIYKADWGKQVEHYLYAELYGTPRILLEADFGFRTPEAQAFAIQCIDTYGPEVHRMMRHRQDPNNCYMRFSLGQLALWGIPASLNLATVSGREVAAQVRRDIELKLFPVIRDVTTLDRLLALLLIDKEPCPWFRCNGAMRAAMIAFLARRLGAKSGQVRALLNPHKKEIAPHLIGAPNPDPSAFIENIIGDSRSSVSDYAG